MRTALASGKERARIGPVQSQRARGATPVLQSIVAVVALLLSFDFSASTEL